MIKLKPKWMDHKIALLSCGLALSFLTGCATTSLWQSQHSVSASTMITAEADQIYVTHKKFDADDSKGPKYCVPFHIREGMSKNHAFPEIEKGFLVIKEMDPIYAESSRRENYDTLFNTSITPVDLYAIKVDKSKRWELNVIYNAVPLSQKDFFTERDTPKGHLLSVSNRLERIPPFNYFSSVHYPPFLIIRQSDYLHDFHYDPSYAPNIFYYYSLCCRKSEGSFYDTFDTTDWLPLLPPEKRPLQMKFYLFETEKIYDHSLFVRLIGTPITAIVDAITFPFQLWFISNLKY